jgi:hypothetical protein
MHGSSLSFPFPHERKRVAGSEASKLALEIDASDPGEAKRRPESIGVGGAVKRPPPWPPLCFDLPSPPLRGGREQIPSHFKGERRDRSCC